MKKTTLKATLAYACLAALIALIFVSCTDNTSEDSAYELIRADDSPDEKEVDKTKITTGPKRGEDFGRNPIKNPSK